MDFKKPRGKPEKEGAQRLIKLMRANGWKCWRFKNEYSNGWPDYYACHPLHGAKWIEAKAPGGGLEPSQCHLFGELNSGKVPVFVLHDEKDYPLLFKEEYLVNGNWWTLAMRFRVR